MCAAFHSTNVRADAIAAILLHLATLAVNLDRPLSLAPARDAMAQTERSGFILVAGGVIPVDTPSENIQARFPWLTKIGGEMSTSAEAKLIWDYHKSQARDTENPPVLLAEASEDKVWVRIWVTGLDTAAWFYELNSAESTPRLVAQNLNTEGPQGMLTSDPSLADASGQKRISRERWQRFANERLAALRK